MLPKRPVLLLFVIPLAVYLILVLVFSTPPGITMTNGDEPHYLLAADSLVRDGDLDLTNNYAAGDYRAFYDGGVLQPGAYLYTLNGHTVRHQAALGMPLLLALPFAVDGRLGVLILLAVLVAAAAPLTYQAARRFVRPDIAFDGVLFCALTYPVIIYSHQIYPETVVMVLVAAALALILAFAGLDLRVRALTLGLAVGLMPQFHSKFAVLSVLFLAYFLWACRARWRTALGWSLAPIFLLAAAFVGGMYGTYGEISRATILPHNYAAYFGARVDAGIMGLFFDQEAGLLFYAPVFVLAFLGLWAMVRARSSRADGIWLAVIYCSLHLLSGVYYDWHAGLSPVPRYLMPVLPVLTIFAVRGVEAAWERRAVVPVLVTAAVGIGITFLILFVQRSFMFRFDVGTNIILRDFFHADAVLPWLPAFSIDPNGAYWRLAGLATVAAGLWFAVRPFDRWLWRISTAAPASLGAPITRQRWIAMLTAWLPFLAVWVWAIRFNPLTEIPGYGDALEVVWGMEWYADKIRTLASPLFYPLIFYPVGWYTASLAHTPLFLFVLGLLRLLLPPAVVYNAAVLLAFAVCYAGLQRMLRLYVTQRWIIILVALIFTFAGMRWLRIYGHLHVVWMSALLPWQVWVIASDMSDRRRVWISGLLWGLAITALLYSVWLGALLYAAYWLAFPRWKSLREIALIGLIALAVSTPSLWLFWQASQASDLLIHGLEHISYWGASLNSLVAPAVGNGFLKNMAAVIYPGPYDESGVMNFGLFLVAIALWGLLHVTLRSPRQRFAVLLTGIGLVFALGPILRWSGQPVRLPFLDALDAHLWHLGQIVKPALFGPVRPPVFLAAVPLPSWLMYALFPLSEGARVAARFAFVAAPGVAVLVAIGLARLRLRALVLLAVVLLVLEAAPSPIVRGAPLPPAAHPAFEWLRKQKVSGSTAVLDLKSGQDGLALPISGEMLYATLLHGKPAVTGVGSYWPHTTWIWVKWLAAHRRPFQDPEFTALLRAFGVRWIMLHMDDPRLWDEIKQIDLPAIKLNRCFDAPAGNAAWPDPICVLEVSPSPQRFDVVPDSGWSGAEEWGRWAEGTRSEARWVAPVRGAYRLTLNAFPQCVPGRRQEIRITANDKPAGAVTFQGCDPASASIDLPAASVNLGWNRLAFEYAYAQAAPGGSDPRRLSVGYTQLQIEPITAAPGGSQ